MKKHYIEWMYPGIIVSETGVEEIPSRRRPNKVPKGAFAYRFFDRSEVNLDGEILRGDRKNVSGIVYLGGQVMTLEEVKKMPGDNKILISNMETNGWNRVIKTKNGQVMRLHPEDQVDRSL